MTIQVALDPALELQVTAAASARGMSLDEYVNEALLEKAQARLRERIAAWKPTITVEEFLQAMAYHGPIPEEMRTQEITREFIYGDHPE